MKPPTKIQCLALAALIVIACVIGCSATETEPSQRQRAEYMVRAACGENAAAKFKESMREATEAMTMESAILWTFGCNLKDSSR